MTRRTLAATAALLVSLVVVSGAQAHTTIVAPEGSGYPYQRWIDESAVPTPDTTVEVIEAPCPEAETDAYGCTLPQEGRLWLDIPAITAETRTWVRFYFYHEMGHNFDADLMTPWARTRFAELRHTHRPWSDTEAFEEEGLEEYFAEMFVLCALDRPALWRETSVSYAPRECRLIDDVATSSGLASK